MASLSYPTLACKYQHLRSPTPFLGDSRASTPFSPISIDSSPSPRSSPDFSDMDRSITPEPSAFAFKPIAPPALLSKDDRKDPEHQSCLRIPIKGGEKPQKPPYYNQMVQDRAHELLELSTCVSWGKEEYRLDFLNECSCIPLLNRIKHPFPRLAFDKSLKDRVVSISKDTTDISITHFASGRLFGTLVQTVQMVHELRLKNWKGKIHLNLIDNLYAAFVQFGPDDKSMPAIARAFRFIRDELAKILPPGIEIDMNVFSNYEDYLSVGVKFDCLVGVDLDAASKIWEKTHCFKEARRSNPYIAELRKEKDRLVTYIEVDGKMSKTSYKP